MYSGKSKSLFNIRSLEKLSYVIVIPSVFGYLSYKMYKQNVLEVEERALALKKVEDKLF